MMCAPHPVIPSIRALNIFRRRNQSRQREETLTNFESESDDIYQRHVRNLKRALVVTSVAALIGAGIYACRAYKSNAHPGNMDSQNYQLNVQPRGK